MPALEVLAAIIVVLIGNIFHERKRAEQERQRAEQERQRADRAELQAKLRVADLLAAGPWREKSGSYKQTPVPKRVAELRAFPQRQRSLARLQA
eukprot:tig00000076_g2402.t1